MVLEGHEGVVCLVLSELQLAPVMVPALGDKDVDPGSLCGTEQEELSFKLEARVHSVGTDDCVDAGAGGV